MSRGIKTNLGNNYCRMNAEITTGCVIFNLIIPSSKLFTSTHIFTMTFVLLKGFWTLPALVTH